MENIFTFRYGSGQFCLELIQSCLHLTQWGNGSFRLLSLINRLLPLLSAAGRLAVLKSYPLDKCPDVWSALNWNTFPTEQQVIFQRFFTNLSGPSQ